MADSTRKRRRRKDADRPGKPSPEFPLSPHPSGAWQKKIRGKIHYFGRWARRVDGKLVRVEGDGWREALEEYKAVADDLHAGRTPRVKADGLTVADLCNRFLTAKLRKREAGELGLRMFADYREMTDLIVATFGTTRLVEDLAAEDFEALRARMAERWGPVRLGNAIIRVKSVFKYALDNGLSDKPVRFGGEFRKPNRAVLRRHRAANGTKMLEATELRQLLGYPPWAPPNSICGPAATPLTTPARRVPTATAAGICGIPVIRFTSGACIRAGPTSFSATPLCISSATPSEPIWSTWLHAAAARSTTAGNDSPTCCALNGKLASFRAISSSVIGPPERPFGKTSGRGGADDGADGGVARIVQRGARLFVAGGPGRLQSLRAGGPVPGREHVLRGERRPATPRRPGPDTSCGRRPRREPRQGVGEILRLITAWTCCSAEHRRQLDLQTLVPAADALMLFRTTLEETRGQSSTV